jgi:hypothetical protein
MDVPRVSPEFASVLRSGRDLFNARFAEAKHQYGALDPQAFLDFLRTSLDPLVVAVSALGRECASPVVQAAYDVGLALVGQGLAGPRARTPYLDACFSRALPALAHLLVRSPEATLALVCNATHHIGAVHGGRPEQFVERLTQLSSLLSDFETLERAGRVLAWQAGLAHFREAALAELPNLPATLEREVLGVQNDADVSAVVARLHSDPWYDPTSGAQPTERWVGAFRGFGGLFGAPPRVTTSEGRLLVASGDTFWLVFADAYGATFHRATPSEVARAAPFRSGKVVPRNIERAARGEVVSWVKLPTTIACSYARSHALLLVPASLGD